MHCVWDGTSVLILYFVFREAMAFRSENHGMQWNVACNFSWTMARGGSASVRLQLVAAAARGEESQRLVCKSREWHVVSAALGCGRWQCRLPARARPCVHACVLPMGAGQFVIVFVAIL